MEKEEKEKVSVKGLLTTKLITELMYAKEMGAMVSKAEIALGTVLNKAQLHEFRMSQKIAFMLGVASVMKILAEADEDLGQRATALLVKDLVDAIKDEPETTDPKEIN